MFRTTLQHERSFWYSGAALVCFVVAVATGVVGSFLTTAALVNAQQHPTLNAIGLLSLITSVPILILGGHWLDLKDRKREISRAANRTLQD